MAENTAPSALFLETLRQWTEAKTALAHFKDLESQLRVALIKEAFPKKKALSEGTFKYDLPHGWALSMQAKVTIAIDEAALDSTLVLLRNNNINPDTIFGSTPKFLKAGYKELDDNGKKLVQTALTFKDASPTLDLIAPKQAKA